MPIKIGTIEFRNNFILAPMSGVSDVPFRKSAWDYGAGMVVSEMVASESFVTGMQEMKVKSASAGLPVHMVQLSGRQAEWLAKAALLAQESGAKIIDINMGCPARRVTNGLAGSALMRDLDHATKLIEAVIKAVSVPVTLKMRLGWDETSINAPQLAKRAVECGVELITVHGRTRNQFYKGKANWNAIRAVRDEVSIPLLVNGDICDFASATEAKNKSGADGVMIGRASYGAPWLPGLLAWRQEKELGNNPAAFPIDPENPATWRDAICTHYEAIHETYEPTVAIRHARKHIGWYLENANAVCPNSGFDDKSMRINLLRSNDRNYVLKQLDQLFSSAISGENSGGNEISGEMAA